MSRHFKVIHERNLSLKETVLRRRRVTSTTFWALRDVDLDIAPGESVGIMGRNGAGKSTMLKLVARILAPSAGTIETAGTIASMLELGAGFHPDFTGRENVFLNAAVLGIGRREIAERFDDIVAFAELEEFIDAPVRTYSSGMQLRLAFAVASHVRSDIMLLDEVFAVGDESFQRKCLGRMYDFRRHGGTILFVSHDAGSVERLCDRVLLIERGEIVGDGPPTEVISDYHRRLSADTGGGTTEGGDDRITGSGEVEISDCRVVDAAGRPTESLLSGDPCAVEIDYSVIEAVPGIRATVSITGVDGTPVYSLSLGADAERPLQSAGEATIRFVIPELRLHEGRFAVGVQLGSPDETTVYRGLAGWREFSVFPRGRGSGLVDLDARWEIVERARQSI